MANTFQFQCQNCGKILERPQNPKVCDSCGKTVMRPVEVSEPSSEQNSLKTEDFDVNSALSELEGMKPQKSKNTVDTPNLEGQESSQNSSSPESSEDSNNGSFLSLLKSLF